LEDPPADPDPDARFGLANERTFLAWGRTCLALVATGLVLARVVGQGEDDTLTLAAGLGLIALGALLAVGAYRTYRRNDAAMRAGAPLRPSSLPLALMISILLAAAVAVVLSVAR
jgi:putative membrane protein